MKALLRALPLLLAIPALGQRPGLEQDVPAIFLRYLNRLSDLLFTLARLANYDEGLEDETW